MKLSVFAVMFGGMKFEAALDYIKSVEVEAVEIGCGGYVGDDPRISRGPSMDYYLPVGR